MTVAGTHSRTKRKSGNSRASAQQKRALFVEVYLSNGENATQAAEKAGFSAKTAYSAGSRLLKDPWVKGEIERRKAEVLANAMQKTQLTADEVLESLARDLRFDPAKLYREDGTLKPIHEIDEDTRLAMRGMKVFEEYAGRGDERTLTGYTKEAKFPEKTAAREQAMKHFGLYREDNEQKPPTVALPEGVKSVRMDFSKIRARAKETAAKR